ncbi:MAG: hypothetical protein QOJ35_3032 [Solirubrobacteraceae bacterium]|nr:hypothetical protein [Solirubrobacteraceae bacterium]
MAQRDADDEQDAAARAVTGAHPRAGRPGREMELRAVAAEQRALAARDRGAAAIDREHAAAERLRARTDREAFAGALALTETDTLTGARTRAAGLTELDHELDRCRRTDSRLVVAYVDVVGLKAVNDSEGHAAGDELLRNIVAILREHLRSYDLIVRVGGDEFLCAMSNMSLPDARRRFRALAAELATAPEAGAIRAGFAALAPDDTPTELIARADGELLDEGRRRPDERP